MPYPVDLKFMNAVQSQTSAEFETTEEWLEAREVDLAAFVEFCTHHSEQGAALNSGIATLFGVGIQLGYELRRAQENFGD